MCSDPTCQNGTNAIAELLTSKFFVCLSDKNKSFTSVEKELCEKFLNNINCKTEIELNTVYYP
jgi:hypothetical protein